MSTASSSSKEQKISFILASQSYEEENQTEVKGWIRFLRKGKKFSFMVLNDGSCHDNLQVVIDSNTLEYDKIVQMNMGSSVKVTGRVVPSQGKGQRWEMQAQSVELIGDVGADYPLQKKSTSLEFLREIAHLRPRTQTFSAVFRIRHLLSYATHKFFNDNGYYYLNTPIITGSDCEGAGEMFRVSTLDPNNVPKSKDGKVDFEQDFFGKETNLTVSGQLSAECFALGMGAVYTFGPTFRAENSNTPRHLAEFWMIEPEAAFMDLEGLVALASDYLKYLVSYVLDHAPSELAFFESTYKEGLVEDLKNLRDADFKTVTYTSAMEILEEAAKQGHKFDYRPSWGIDLQTEHERYLTDTHFKAPVIVTDYPTEIKAFYMKRNADGKTVRAMDVLVPGVGEIIGGSQREDNLEALENRIEEMNLNKEDYWWYLDLRKFGGAPHSGFGLGLERMVMYVTGLTNIRDVIAFPRTPRNAEF